MPVLIQVLLVVHVMAAMLWFGGTAFAPRRMREALAAERPEAGRHMQALVAQGKVFGMAATLVLLTGVAMAVLRPGGFGGLPVRFHIALLLTLIWWALGLFVVRPAVNGAAEVVAGEGDLAPAHAAAKRVAMMAGILHTLFTVSLVLMLWRL